MMETPPHWHLDVGAEGAPLRLRIWELGAVPDAAEGPPLVCLHGWLDQGLCWAAVGRELQARLPGRRIVAPDQRGFGGSDRVGAGGYYHFPDYVADLERLADHLVGPDGAIDLAGHSMGGTVSGWFAGARPERVRRLALVEGIGPMPPTEDDPVERLRLFLDGRARPRKVPRVQDIAHGAARLRRRNPALDEAHATLLATHGTAPVDGGRCRQWTFDPQHLLRSPTPFRPAWFRRALEEVAAPTLVVWGEDTWYPPEVMARRITWLSGAASVREETLPGGHMVPYEAARELAGLLAMHLG